MIKNKRNFATLAITALAMKILAWVIIIIGVVGLIVGGYIVYRLWDFASRHLAPPPTAPSQSNNPAPPVDPPTQATLPMQHIYGHTSVASLSASKMVFTVQYESDTPCWAVVQRSEDLVNWVPLNTNQCPAGVGQVFTDTNGPINQAYYRVVCTPQ